MEFPKTPWHPNAGSDPSSAETRVAARPIARWIIAVVIGLVILGGLLRWVNLDGKAYWIDEAFSSFHVSGFSDAITKERLVQNRPLLNESLQLFQTINGERSAMDTVEHIAATAPELPPLYFLTLRAWTSLFGDSLAAIRSLSVLLGLLLFPAFYGLAKELSGHRDVAWAALAVVAISPYQILYAQEARPYTLWALAIVGSHWLLLRALRCQGWSNWLGYGLCLTAGLYTHILTFPILAAQGLYVWHRSHWQLSSALVRKWLLMAVGIGLCYVPWVMLALINLTNSPAVHASEISRGAWLVSMAKSAIRTSSLIFADFNIGQLEHGGFTLFRKVGFGVSLGLIGATIVSLFKFWPSLPANQRLFLSWNILVPISVFLAADILFPSARPYINSPRYLLGSILVFQLLVGAWIIQVCQRGSAWNRMVVAGILAIGVMSSSFLVTANQWWHKDTDNANRAIAAIVNSADKPVLVTDGFFIRPLALSHVLNPDVAWVLSPEGTAPTVPPGFKTVYAFACTPTVLDQLKRSYALFPAADRLVELRSLPPKAQP